MSECFGDNIALRCCIRLKYDFCVYFDVVKCMCLFVAVLRAFAAVETVESMNALVHGSHITPLSIQETLDCSYGYDGILYSCYGGDTCAAFDWMKKVYTVAVIALPTEVNKLFIEQRFM